MGRNNISAALSKPEIAASKHGHTHLAELYIFHASVQNASRKSRILCCVVEWHVICAGAHAKTLCLWFFCLGLCA